MNPRSASSPAAPRWMRMMLWVAGIYNILWGAWAVLFPTALFDWLGMAQPSYPQLWQCIGMIVGVYGVGYAIAATDPARHWPVVLVGLLGKVFGPIGMAQAVWEGSLPAAFAVTCVTNDVIWWVPFGLVLKHAWEVHLGQSEEAEKGPLPGERTLLAEAVTSTGQSLAELSQETPLLLVFLRHSGCTFCREALADLARVRQAIEASGTRIALVHMGEPAAFATFSGQYGLSDLPAVADPSRRLYGGLGLRRGKISQLLGWKVWWRGFQAFLRGHRVGKFEGDVTQLPGVFLIFRGGVLRRHFHQTSADRPDYQVLAKAP
ncbi:peroxiredoxin-like family protein [Verrucomicrobium sp. BvORR034]|uniref:peroxiredoxin-like family protein n=1 Tax=Verrucomicrobium sp. BvORR034 TaxID=1396418 RepID=UPI002240FAEA|nr:peroxiredoxin-like family protein [Verrucomicrobium sp. BvORR034]